MKIKDLIAAIRDYSKLRQALEESNTELDSTEKIRQFYDCIAPDFDESGFRLYDAALSIFGHPNLPGEFPYEDNRGAFDEADGHQLLKYLTALRFHAIQWEIVPGTPYEKATLLDVDTAAPEYRAFEKQLYTQTLRDLGFQGLLPQEQERRIGKQKEKRKEGAER